MISSLPLDIALDITLVNIQAGWLVFKEKVHLQADTLEESWCCTIPQFRLDIPLDILLEGSVLRTYVNSMQNACDWHAKRM